MFEVAFDLSKVPTHEVVDLQTELMAREPVREGVQSVKFYVDVQTGLLSCWLLLPEGKEFQELRPPALPSRGLFDSGDCHAGQQLQLDGRLASVVLAAQSEAWSQV